MIQSLSYARISRALTLPFGGLQKSGQKRKNGFTLIEILIVVALLVGLMALLMKNFVGSADNAKKDQARIGMSQLSQALQLYRVHNSKYPTTEQGLQALIKNPGEGVVRWSGPYTEENKLNDPWNNPFDYESDGRTYQIKSNGGDDGQPIYFPEKAGEKDAPAAEGSPQ